MNDPLFDWIVAGASLPPKQRIKLYQPRTKLEQFEDILIESQLLEASLPEFEVAAFAEAAGRFQILSFHSYNLNTQNPDSSEYCTIYCPVFR